MMKLSFPGIASRAGLRLVLASAIGVSFSAQATTFVELEPNDTLATAQLLIHNGSIELNGFRESSPTNGFNDFFRFSATVGDQLVFRVNAIGGGDPLIRLLSSTGTFLAQDDDGGGGFNSLISYNVTNSGDYVAAVRGFGNSVYSYDLKITGLTPVSAVPEPGEWAMLLCGLAFVSTVARRRTRT
jgi:Bacterial pre-peptidase C-terminal domain